MLHKKNYEKQYKIFEPYLPIVPVKVEFLSTDFFGGLKDNINKQPRLIIIAIYDHSS